MNQNRTGISSASTSDLSWVVDPHFERAGLPVNFGNHLISVTYIPESTIRTLDVQGALFDPESETLLTLSARCTRTP